MTSIESHQPAPKYDLIFLGDFCPCNCKKTDNLAIGQNLKAILNNCEFSMVNLECPLTTAETKIAKRGPYLKAQPEAARLLDDLGIKACNLANNHIRDYGSEGIRETCATLDGYDIRHFGLWGNCGNQYLILEVQGWRVGLMSFTENEFSTDRSEGSSALGLDCSLQLKQLNELKEKTDYIIAQYHGGVELYPYPTPGQRKYCHFLIDAGADLVICHHSHVVSGWECYSDRKIFYGLGNFFFPEAGNPADWFEGLGIGLRFGAGPQIGTFQVAYDIQANALDINEDPQVSNRINEIKKTVADDRSLKKAWDDFCLASRERTLKSLFKPGRFLRLLLRLGFMQDWLDNKADISLLNLLRCESHHEKITHTLELINKGRDDRRNP